MKKAVLSAVIVLTIVSSSFSFAFDATVQKMWRGKQIYSVSFMKNLKAYRHYILIGVNTYPSINRKEEIKYNSSREKSEFNSYYGAYSGYYFAVAPIFRPGVHVGFGFKGREKKYLVDGDYKFGKYTYDIEPYYALGIQVAVLSFIVSNEGIGGGINIQF